MEIRPATLVQIHKARNGQYISIDDDVQGVANALAAIDHRIRLRYSEAGEYFVVYWKPEEWEEGDGYLIFTSQDLDHRLVTRMEEVYFKCQQPGYSFADELEKRELEAKQEKDAKFTEDNGEKYERLAHAMRKELGYNQGRIFVPTELKS